MKINATPFFFASGFGILYQVILVGLSAVLAALVFPGLLEGDFSSFDQDISNLLIISTLVSCLSTIITYTGYALTGVVYSFFQQRTGDPDIGEGVIGGAASAMVASVVGTVAGTVANLLIEWSFVTSSQPGLPGNFGFSDLAIGSLAGLVITLCVGLLFSGALGAIGGAITTAIFKARAARREQLAV